MTKIYSLISKCLIVFTVGAFFGIDARAQAGLSLNFDGVNDYVQTPVLLPASYTKEAWVKISDITGFNNNIVSGNETMECIISGCQGGNCRQGITILLILSQIQNCSLLILGIMLR